MDASVARFGSGGSAAAVWRDAEGRFMGSSALVVRGIFYATTLVPQNFGVASHSKQVIKDIDEGTSSSYGSIVGEVK